MACTSPAEQLINPIGCAASSVTSTISDAGLSALASGMGDMFGKMVRLLLTWWLNLPSPDLTGSGSAIRFINSAMLPLTAAATVLGLIWAGVGLAWRARIGEDGRAVLKGALLTIVIVGAGAILMDALIVGADTWGKHILRSGFDGKSVGARMLAMTQTASAVPVLGPGLAFLAYLLAGLASAGQAAIMLLRGPITVLMCGIWPTAAAATLTRTGGEFFRRITAWLISWALYPFFASLIYATAFYMIGDSTDLAGVLGGLLLITMAVLTLPALIRLLTPAISAVPGAGAGGAAALAGGAEMATGAVAVRSGSAAGGAATSAIGQASPASAGAAAPTGAVAASGSAAAGPIVGMAAGAAKAGSQAAGDLTRRATETQPEQSRSST